MPDDFWDDVPEVAEVPTNVIPELLDTPLVRALPEMKKLAAYGGNSYDANLRLAAARARLLRDKIKIAIQAPDPLNLDLLAPSSPSELFPGIPNEEQLSDLARSLGINATFFSREVGNSSYTNYDHLGFFLGFLKNDDPSKTIDDVLDDVLRRGVTYSAHRESRVSSDVFGSISIPLKAKRNQAGEMIGVEPAVDISDYQIALDRLSEFKTSNTITNTFKGSRISIEIAANQADFEDRYSKVSSIARDLTSTEGINFSINAGGTEILRSQLGSVGVVRSKIILNHEVASSRVGTFGGNNSIGEALFHEYGHSVHRQLGIDWGITAPDPSYEPVFQNRVSNYGSNSHAEHFAESFANMLTTNTATPEFKEFLKNKLNISEIDMSVLPDYIRNNNLIESFIEGINNDPRMNGYTFVASSIYSPLSEGKENKLREVAAAMSDPNRRASKLTFNLEGHFKDPQGREIKLPGLNVQRTFTWDNGDLTVYHDYFKLPDSAQGGGLGTAYIESSFDHYKKIGLRRVTVSAALDNGPYQWALMGFNWDKDRGGDTSRNSALANVQIHHKVLENYQANLGFYGNLGPESVAAAMKPELPGITEFQIKNIINTARDSGWDVTNDLVNQLKFIAEHNPEGVTPFMIANIGRGNKKAGGKAASTIGRVIMMSLHSWPGYKDM